MGAVRRGDIRLGATALRCRGGGMFPSRPESACNALAGRRRTEEMLLKMRGIEHIPWLYDAGMSVFDRLGLARWRAELVGALRGRVLEVGCGTGRALPGYGPEARVIGIDPDTAALKRAQRRAGGAGLASARVEALPFADGAFDVVVTSLCFCSVDDPARGLSEIRRVLRDEGELRMLEHVRARHAGWARWQDRLEPAWRGISGGCRLNRDTEATVREAGFDIDPESLRAWSVLRCFSASKRIDDQQAPRSCHDGSDPLAP